MYDDSYLVNSYLRKLNNELDYLYLKKSLFYLYSKEDGEFLSIISPNEWNNKYEYIGKYQLQSDGRWVNLD